jgi:prophage regulatory protein
MARHRAARSNTPARQSTTDAPSPASTTGLSSPSPALPLKPAAATPLLTGGDRLLRLQEVIALVSISRATIYRYLGAGMFPSPLQIGPRRVAWRASDINIWCAGLHATSATAT